MANEINAHTRVRLQWPTDPAVELGGSFNAYHDEADGAINYTSSINNLPIEAWPEGRGALGFGRGRFGRGPFGRGDGGFGFGRGWFGRGPFGHGAKMLQFITPELIDGDYKFAVCGVDKAGNVETPATIEEELTLAEEPEPPTNLTVTGYVKGTDTLTINYALSADDEEI